MNLEMQAMIREVAKQSAQEAIKLTKAEIRFEMLEMEGRLTGVIDSRLEKYLGMSSPEHVIQHANLDVMIKDRQNIRRAVIEGTFKYISIAILAAAVSSYIGSNSLTQDKTMRAIAIKEMAVPTLEAKSVNAEGSL